jgi:sugar O-acyltransferase (sialic acid O-acetyltransferase NeuD family)
MNPTRIVIVGAGGLGREVLATIRACNAVRREWDVLGFLDPDPKLARSKVAGIPILGDDDWCRNHNEESLRFICAIGKPKARRQVVERLLAMNCRFASISHPDVQIPETVRIGAGTLIMAGTRFTTDASIGSHVVLYLNCSITHDVSVGDYCLIASGCNLSGASVLETGVELGTGVSVLPGRRIGAWAVIGAGSIVVDDIPGDTTAIGTPCRVIKQHAGES